MATIITLIASFCLIIIAIKIKDNNSKKAKKDAEDFIGIINPLMYKDYGSKNIDRQIKASSSRC